MITLVGVPVQEPDEVPLHVRLLVLMVTVEVAPIDIAWDPAFFTAKVSVGEKLAPEVSVDPDTTVNETNWMLYCEAPLLINPYIVAVTMAPTPRTAAMMMNRSRLCETAERFLPVRLLIFIDGRVRGRL